MTLSITRQGGLQTSARARLPRILFPFAGAALLLCAAAAGHAQYSPGLPGEGDQIRTHLSDGAEELRQAREALELRRLRMMNADRHKAMISDADKLLRLAQELNATLAAGSSGMPPAERIHKAAEIEKLARQVKDKMTYAAELPATAAPPFGVGPR